MKNDDGLAEFIASEFFSERLKYLLEERDLDQRWLAMRLGVTPGAVSIMLSRNNPKLYTVLRIARELDMPIEEFLEGYENYIQT